MPELFSQTIVQLIIYFAILAIMTGVAIYVAGLFRADSLQKELNTEEHLDYFRELNLQGKLSKEEFRIIKKQLSNRIVDEEKKKIELIFKESADTPEILLARLRNIHAVPENRDDTQLFMENTEETVVDR